MEINKTRKRTYHKPIYGLTKEECLKKHYRRFINNRCSYRKCRGNSHYYNKYNKCLSMKHFDDIEPSHKKPYRGKNPRLICESKHRGPHWRYFDGKCYRKTCKTEGSVFAYYNGRCTPRPQYFKHLMNKFRVIEQKAEIQIKNVKSPSEYSNIYKNANKEVKKVKHDAQMLLDDIKKEPTQIKIKHAKDDKIISQETADKLNDADNTHKSDIIDNAKKDVSKQAFGVLENIKNNIRNLLSGNKQTAL
jgi:hypothetical protein